MCYDDASVDRHASLSREDKYELPNDPKQLKAIILKQQDEIKALRKLHETAEEIMALYKQREEIWTGIMEDDKK